jgi:hypothetical protein
VGWDACSAALRWAAGDHAFARGPRLHRPVSRATGDRRDARRRGAAQTASWSVSITRGFRTSSGCARGCVRAPAARSGRRGDGGQLRYAGGVRFGPSTTERARLRSVLARLERPRAARSRVRRAQPVVAVDVDTTAVLADRCATPCSATSHCSMGRRGLLCGGPGEARPSQQLLGGHTPSEVCRRAPAAASRWPRGPGFDLSRLTGRRRTLILTRSV